MEPYIGCDATLVTLSKESTLRCGQYFIKIAYVRTDDMLADMLTKLVAKSKLDLCNRGIGMG